jgi:WD repeat-containing protein 6
MCTYVFLCVVRLYAGIWTDGSWVFSTGLDQRVRCWRLDQFGKLAEYAYLIISVPEPETLDAMISNR